MKKLVSVGAIASLLTLVSGLSLAAVDSAEMFKKLDIDADGYITVEEAEAHADLPDAFADGDANEDGLLDMAEFAKLEITDE